MTLTALTSYEFSLFLHITAAVVGFGATFAESIMFQVATKLDVRHLPYVHKLQLAINQYFATPALVIVLATGFYQVAEGNWQLGDFWLSATLLIVIVIGGILGAYFIPADRKLGPMVEREIAALGDGEIKLSDLSAEYARLGRREGVIGTVVGLLLIAAIFLMVDKPGL